MISFTPMSIEEGRARRKNSIVIGLVLFALVASFYIVTIVKLQGNVAKRMSTGSSGGQTVSTSTTKVQAFDKSSTERGSN